MNEKTRKRERNANQRVTGVGEGKDGEEKIRSIAVVSACGLNG